MTTERDDDERQAIGERIFEDLAGLGVAAGDPTRRRGLVRTVLDHRLPDEWGAVLDSIKRNSPPDAIAGAVVRAISNGEVWNDHVFVSTTQRARPPERTAEAHRSPGSRLPPKEACAPGLPGITELMSEHGIGFQEASGMWNQLYQEAKKP